MKYCNSYPFGGLRHCAAKLLYFAVRYGMPLHARFAGYQRSVVGKCLILAPAKQMEAILEGIKFLQTIDSEMFERLTAERRYVFWYNPTRFLQCQEIFTITDSFLLWGKEGVAVCFAQAVLEFNVIYLPFAKILARDREKATAGRLEVQQRLRNWVRRHTFPDELAKQYEEFATRYREW